MAIDFDPVGVLLQQTAYLAPRETIVAEMPVDLPDKFEILRGVYGPSQM